MKHCPPGTICFENTTMIFMVIVLLFFIYMGYSHSTTKTNAPNDSIIFEDNNTPIYSSVISTQPQTASMNMVPNYPYDNWFSPFNGPSNVLGNPYTPPLKDSRYLVRGQPVPVSIETNAINTNYRQVGILTPVNGKQAEVLPLMGRPRNSSRNMWQYYTISGVNGIKLPISINGKSGTNEYGVDELYNGDTVYAEGYDQTLKVTIYDNDTIRYI